MITFNKKFYYGAVDLLFSPDMVKIDYNLKKIASYIGIGLGILTIGYVQQTRKILLNVSVGIDLVFLYYFYCSMKEGLINIV
jgi:hypothetical protein